MKLNIMNLAVDIASETRSVRDSVYEKRKETILMQRYKPGSHLIERLLAAI
jgi:DNA-binding GntR family transcriptional regulator